MGVASSLHIDLVFVTNTALVSFHERIFPAGEDQDRGKLWSSYHTCDLPARMSLVSVVTIRDDACVQGAATLSSTILGCSR